mmetsp:Transcript_17075/g.40357  ORF Transcript_17075/g.40357 Transcript_17075/m.40357 type:complete len:222 (+) Transcript_17075:461-1126(+)
MRSGPTQPAPSRGPSPHRDPPQPVRRTRSPAPGSAPQPLQPPCPRTWGAFQAAHCSSCTPPLRCPGRSSGRRRGSSRGPCQADAASRPRAPPASCSRRPNRAPAPAAGSAAAGTSSNPSACTCPCTARRPCTAGSLRTYQSHPCTSRQSRPRRPHFLRHRPCTWRSPCTAGSRRCPGSFQSLGCTSGSLGCSAGSCPAGTGPAGTGPATEDSRRTPDWRRS